MIQTSELVTEITRTACKAILDLIFVSNPTNVLKNVVPQVGLSDHYPVAFVHKVNC